MASQVQLPSKTDVLIVGAGVSGLYAAWRLLRQDGKRKITIVDRLNRTGGRLDSDLVRLPDPYDNENVVVKEEEGGMRFEHNMASLMSLFNALRLCDDAVYFPMTTNRLAFRGHSFTAAESVEDNNAIWGELYDLEPAEQNQSPGAILGVVYDRIVKANGVENPPSAPTPEFWQRFRLDFKWEGIPLNQWQLGGLLRAMGYSEECITMVTDTSGFRGPFQALPNAGEAWQILEDFPANPQYFTLKYGFSSLIRRLEKEVRKMGAEIYLGVNVNTINGKTGAYEVETSVAKPGNSAYVFDPNDARAVVKAEKIILAIPSQPMTTLFAASPTIYRNPQARQFWEDIHSVQNMRLLKINLYFETPWWYDGSTGQPPVAAGPSFTDLPVNSVYPFYSVQTQPGEPDPGKPAALTIYCDYTNTNFWEGLQNVGPKFDSDLQKAHEKSPETLYPASRAVVNEAIRQFKILFKTHYIPQPVLTSFRLWSGENDFPYAYHQWGLNANDREVMPRMTQPLEGEAIYTCNEAWSDMQGWVNGSLRSTDLMLSTHFGLKPITEEFDPCPDFIVPKDYR